MGKCMDDWEDEDAVMALALALVECRLHEMDGSQYDNTG